MYLSLLWLILSYSAPAQDQVETLINQGYDKYISDNFKGAIKDFNKALTLAPENAELYYLRGVCKSNMGEKVAAMDDLNKAIDLDPYYAEAMYEKAYILLSDQNPKDAITELDKVIKLMPEMAEAYVTRGTAKCMMYDKEGANADWEKAKEMGVTYTELMVCE